MIKFSTDPYIAETQMQAIIYYLVAFGYIDAELAPSERGFIQGTIRKLVDQRAEAMLGDDPGKDGVVEHLYQHFNRMLDSVENTIQGYFSESVVGGETHEQFVLSRLKLGCLELMQRFDEDGQRELLAVVEEMMLADGVTHPNEVAFRDEVIELLNTTVELDDAELELIEEGTVIIDQARRLTPKMNNHPFFPQFEWDFINDPETFAQQSEGDMELVQQVMETLARMRDAGRGRLQEADNFAGFAGTEPFLDGHVHVNPPKPGRDHELLVLGDLHGCYSCLKAALLQADFFTKAQAHIDDPERNPPIYVVFLGDYIDRGRFSFSGTLRTAMQLFVKMPEHVFLLRGNHEYYLDMDGKVVAPVRPCEAMDSISKVADNDVFVRYMHLFEQLPNLLVFGNILFVHGGIPRADTLLARWDGLESLNDEDMRFQMMWSDPSEANLVPLDLQMSNARFPFGRLQFKQFMARLGCKTMVRGHQRVVEGFKRIYEDPEAILLSLFSAGGQYNDDLPFLSNYREVTPMALTIRSRDGINTFIPFELDYQRYNDPKYNKFFKDELA